MKKIICSLFFLFAISCKAQEHKLLLLGVESSQPQPVTIGFNPPGGGTGGVVSTKNYLNKYTFPSGKITDMYLWINIFSGNAAVNIWSDSSGTPNAEIYCSAVQAVSPGAYAHFANVNLVIAAGDYWIGSHTDSQRTFSNNTWPFAETAGEVITDCLTVPGVSAQNDQFAEWAVILH